MHSQLLVFFFVFVFRFFFFFSLSNIRALQKIHATLRRLVFLRCCLQDSLADATYIYIFFCASNTSVLFCRCTSMEERKLTLCSSGMCLQVALWVSFLNRRRRTCADSYLRCHSALSFSMISVFHCHIFVCLVLIVISPSCGSHISRRDARDHTRITLIVRGVCRDVIAGMHTCQCTGMDVPFFLCKLVNTQNTFRYAVL